MSYSPWGHRVGHDLPINQQRHTHRKGGERQLEENSLIKSRLFFFLKQMAKGKGLRRPADGRLPGLVCKAMACLRDGQAQVSSGLASKTRFRPGILLLTLGFLSL